MDVTDEGHVLALVNSSDSPRGELWLYQNGKQSVRDPTPSMMVREDTSHPIRLHDFDYEYLIDDTNRFDWIGTQHQVRLNHAQDLAVILSTDSIYKNHDDDVISVYGIKLEGLGTKAPTSSVLYSISLDSFNFKSTDLALGVSNNYIAIGEFNHVVIWKVQNGKYMRYIAIPQHYEHQNRDDEKGLSFVLMNDTDFLMFSCWGPCGDLFYPDVFDIIKFW